MKNGDQPWIIPLKDLFDERGHLRPLQLGRVDHAIKLLSEQLKVVAARVPHEGDLITLARQIAQTSLGLRALERGITLGEGTLKNPAAKLTETERIRLQEELEDQRRFLSRYQEYFRLLQYGYAMASGHDMEDW
jgi:hypothetical protein